MEIFGAPHDLGLANATASAAFSRHFAQRIQRASSFSVIFRRN